MAEDDLEAHPSPRKRLLFCYVEFHHYRVPIWRALAERYDVTVMHGSTRQTDGTEGFAEIPIPPRRLSRFRYQRGLIREVRSGRYDAVIFLFDLAWLSSVIAFLTCPRGTRRIAWGFWMTGSRLANAVRIWLAKRADGCVFYASGAARDFHAAGLPTERIWVARNTVVVEPATRATGTARDTLLFLGSFNARKRNDVTIAAFDAACARIPDHVRLVLVGDGPAKTAAEAQARGLPNGHRIEFRPGTIDSEEIRAHYARAIASVSFGQAGLSVLQSFGHGVPFVTMRGAISGGEIENIVPGGTGVLCEPTQESLTEAFVALCTGPDLAEMLGRGALDYYRDRASGVLMADGLSGAAFGVQHFGERLAVVDPPTRLER